MKNAITSKKSLNSRGFTLIELLATLVIVTVTSVIAVPSLANLVANNRLIAQSNDFVTVLSLARSEAVRRGVRVAICKSDDRASCKNDDLQCLDGLQHGWQMGWIVFSDNNGNDVYDADSENLIRVSSGLSNDNSICTGSHFRNVIVYRPTGSSTNGTFWLCDDRGAEYGRALVVSTTGRVRTTNNLDTCKRS